MTINEVGQVIASCVVVAALLIGDVTTATATATKEDRHLEADPESVPELVNDETNGATIEPLEWAPCEDDPAIECSMVSVPIDYDEPTGPKTDIAVFRVPARNSEERSGTLFTNPGGPGGGGKLGVLAMQFSPLQDNYDIVSFDPRGVLDSGRILCEEEPEFDESEAEPDTDPTTQELLDEAREFQKNCLVNNPELLAHVSTANVARDMELLRQATGGEKLNYIGFSYGTMLGATYASLFPENHRVMVLDGAIDPDSYSNRPEEFWSSYAQAWEDNFDALLDYCSTVEECTFGGEDKQAGFTDLVNKLDAEPVMLNIPSSGPEPVPVTGIGLRAVVGQLLYSRGLWDFTLELLQELEAGDPTLLESFLEAFISQADPFSNSTTAILAVDGDWGTDPTQAVASEEIERTISPNFADVNGLGALDFVFWPVQDDDVFRGPYVNHPEAETVLIVGTTEDNATPYAGAVEMTEQLGNARLLTSEGFGHLAYQNSGPCIDEAIETYINTTELPEPDTICQQDPTYTPAPVQEPDPELPKKSESTNTTEMMVRGSSETFTLNN